MANKITIYRGTTYDMTYNHTDSAGDPVALTGSTVYFTVKSAKYDSDTTDTNATIKKTISSHTDAAGGITTWQLTDSDTQVDPGKYYFDVVVENTDGETDPPSLIGEFSVLGKRTNRNV